MQKSSNKNKQGTPAGFKLIKVYFIIYILLNLFDLFKENLFETLTNLVFIIIAGVIIFGINKRYKFGRYVIYMSTLYSIIYTLIITIVFLVSKKPIDGNDVNFIAKAVYLSFVMLMADIIINIIIFYYTYKHK